MGGVKIWLEDILNVSPLLEWCSLAEPKQIIINHIREQHNMQSYLLLIAEPFRFILILKRKNLTGTI